MVKRDDDIEFSAQLPPEHRVARFAFRQPGETLPRKFIQPRIQPVAFLVAEQPLLRPHGDLIRTPQCTDFSRQASARDNWPAPRPAPRFFDPMLSPLPSAECATLPAPRVIFPRKGHRRFAAPARREKILSVREGKVKAAFCSQLFDTGPVQDRRRKFPGLHPAAAASLSASERNLWLRRWTAGPVSSKNFFDPTTCPATPSISSHFFGPIGTTCAASFRIGLQPSSNNFRPDPGRVAAGKSQWPEQFLPF